MYDIYNFTTLRYKAKSQCHHRIVQSADRYQRLAPQSFYYFEKTIVPKIIIENFKILEALTILKMIATFSDPKNNIVPS